MQCDERQGTNTRCDPRPNALRQVSWYCFNHLVGRNAMVTYRHPTKPYRNVQPAEDDQGEQGQGERDVDSNNGEDEEGKKTSRETREGLQN